MLEALTEEHGSQARAAEAVGLSRSYVAKIMAGTRTSVGISAIRTVVDVAGIRMEYFTADQEPLDFRVFIESNPVVPMARRNLKNAQSRDHSQLTWLFGEALTLATLIRENAPESPAGDPIPFLVPAMLKMTANAPFSRIVRGLEAAWKPERLRETVTIPLSRELAEALVLFEEIVAASPLASRLPEVADALLDIDERLSSLLEALEKALEDSSGVS